MRMDEQFMNEVGLGEMPEEEKQAFMQHAEEELEVRVGQGIGAELSDEQMMEFEDIDDIDQAVVWLDHNAPNFREVVEEVYQAFKQELLAERHNIIGA